ncbi:dihydrofolate reductase family protein [Herbiconiux sp.]|uniref:dihydrofolate reductase family protein n=1 Tax=Herbiconiux sp. TaxID=1871186 RepID=UPI0025C14FC7|nr:dihydrofolate reductase family protein [Herbiconiux sp.]
MRPLTYYVAVSLDGFIAAPDGDFSAFLAEGDHMPALLSDYADALPGVALDAFGIEPPRTRFDTVLMGWNTYAVGLPVGLRDPYPHLRSVVFSRHRDPADADPAIEVESRDPIEVVRRLKAEPAPADRPDAGIWLCGGGQLAGVLRHEIDELVLKVNPVLLGSGIRLFENDVTETSPDAPTAAAHPFTLTRSTAYDSGVIVSEYRRAASSPAR